jgi:hypothetical protein
MQLRSGKIVTSSLVKGNIELRSGKIVIRSNYIPRAYIKHKKNIELRSGRLISRESNYTPRAYIKRKKNIELRSGRLVSHENYKKRPYIKRRINISISITPVPEENKRNQMADAHIRAMLDYYKYNYLSMYSTLLHVTNCDHRKTVDMIRDWQVSEQRHKEYMKLNNPKNYADF